MLNRSAPLFKNFELDISFLIDALCTVLYKEKCILSNMFHKQLKCLWFLLFYYFLSSFRLWKNHKNHKNSEKTRFAHNSPNNAPIFNLQKVLECLQFLLDFLW